jgi:hypothetical protein
MFQALSMENFFVYVNFGTHVRSSLVRVELQKDEAPPHEPQFRYVLRTEMADSLPQYIISPVHATIRLQMNQDVDASPKTKVEFAATFY